ncbi:hypothetical protein [Glutamicibacter creatinolyticus]|uniref:hypothetical protein n=1 Tax=Glutamicibacter creatinolyticus TaxID=162496 RepID=UPI0037C19E6F
MSRSNTGSSVLRRLSQWATVVLVAVAIVQKTQKQPPVQMNSSNDVTPDKWKLSLKFLLVTAIVVFVLGWIGLVLNGQAVVNFAGALVVALGGLLAFAAEFGRFRNTYCLRVVAATSIAIGGMLLAFGAWPPIYDFATR